MIPRPRLRRLLVPSHRFSPKHWRDPRDPLKQAFLAGHLPGKLIQRPFDPMHLIHIILPTSDDRDRPFPERMFADLRHELTERFGGVTVFSQGPAEGFWKNEGGTCRDEIIVFEIMAEAIDAGWWSTLRERLELDFRQDEIVVRAIAMQRL